MNLFSASSQWARRPADERFASLAEMHRVCTDYRVKSTTEYFNTNLFRPIVGDNGDVGVQVTVPRTNTTYESRLSNWAFGQLCTKAGAPASYLRELPAYKAADLLEYGMEKMQHDAVQTLFYQGGASPLTRSIMTPSYRRIWNSEITERLMALSQYGWKVPPARPVHDRFPGMRRATEEDVLNDAAFSLSIRVGDAIAPAGLYASDHDMFAFMVDPNKQIEDGSGEPLFRGFFASNSEVGAAVFKLTTFLYRHVCGNHIVWGAAAVKVFKIKHIGAAHAIFTNEFEDQLRLYSNASIVDDQKLITSARQTTLGKDKEESIKTVMSKGIKLGKRLLSDGYDEAEMNEDTDGPPNTVWSLVQGLTRISQTPAYSGLYQDERNKIDAGASEILKLAA